MKIVAQWGPKQVGFFDRHWKPRLEVAPQVLSQFQDRWLLSEDAFPLDHALAAILYVFAFDFHSTGFIGYDGLTEADLLRRTVDDWAESTGSAVAECGNLLPRTGAATCAATCCSVVEDLRAILVDSVSKWENDPVDPSCDVVVRQLLEQLGAEGHVVINRC